MCKAQPEWKVGKLTVASRSQETGFGAGLSERRNPLSKPLCILSDWTDPAASKADGPEILRSVAT